MASSLSRDRHDRDVGKISWAGCRPGRTGGRRVERTIFGERNGWPTDHGGATGFPVRFSGVSDLRRGERTDGSGRPPGRDNRILR